ncbi:hypothetical protein HJFPF1_08615 [Paramyrothecium foliicola]|nr:hypothetical protein HJFPF1_08615 [Paramyrothecium foliicola]
MTDYSVYLIVSQGGGERDHHAIFVETERGAGTIFQVVGNIQQGMSFEVKNSGPPDSELTFLAKKRLGSMHHLDMDRMEKLCRENPAPEKQFEGPRRLRPGKPLRRCQEWTRETIAILRDNGIVSDPGAP